jgi:transposase
VNELSRKFMAWQGPRRHAVDALHLARAEIRQLESWAAGARCQRHLAMRARIILSCNDGGSDSRIAQQLHVASRTVGKWRARFQARRLAGLLDAPRSGAPRSISDATVEVVLSLTLERRAGAPRWSSRRLAAVAGVSQTTVLRIWRLFGLHPQNL